MRTITKHEKPVDWRKWEPDDEKRALWNAKYRGIGVTQHHVLTYYAASGFSLATVHFDRGEIILSDEKSKVTQRVKLSFIPRNYRLKISSRANERGSFTISLPKLLKALDDVAWDELPFVHLSAFPAEAIGGGTKKTKPSFTVHFVSGPTSMIWRDIKVLAYHESETINEET